MSKPTERQLRRQAMGAAPGEELSPKAAEAMAEFVIAEETKTEEMVPATRGGPESIWQWAPLLLGLPVKYDTRALSRRPCVMWTAVILIAAVTIMLLVTRSMGNAINGWGFVPDEWFRMGGLTLLTSFVLHEGLVHWLSNTYFLVVFGGNVEDALGRIKFALLLLGSHLAGVMLHGLLDLRSDVPVVGASAGIFGMLACYAVMFPHAKVGLFRWWWGPMRVSAWLVVLMYLAMQLVGAYMQANGFGTVSNLGHLGGAAVGLAAGIAWRVNRREEAPGQAGAVEVEQER